MTVISPDARRVWRAARGPVLIVLVIVVAGIVIALLRGTGEGGTLDPRAVTSDGSRALARLLEAQGVRIDLAESLSTVDGLLGSGPATLLITRPDLVPPEGFAALTERAAELVLVAPPDLPGLPVRRTGAVDVTERSPGCSLAAAVAAGVATMGGVQYSGAAELCYSGTLARGAGITVLGNGSPLTNEHLDREGNAALAMRLLGQQPRLIWYMPSPSDPGLPRDRSLTDLLPAGWRFGLAQLVIAVVVLALWRARRLGPVVSEPLPVTVRAAEAVEGRARLYQRAGAVDHAAQALRQAARGRLITRLGLPRDAAPAAVVAAVTTRTGQPAAQVHDVLYGPPPTGDAALVRLADALDSVESEVV